MEQLREPDRIIDVDVLLVLDFDNTLARTRLIQEVLEAAVERIHGQGAADMLRFGRSQSQGFDTCRFLRDEMGVYEEELAAIKETFLQDVAEQGIEKFFEEGAAELMADLRGSEQPYTILTTGGDEWQLWKLQALGLGDVPYHITSGREKSLLLIEGYDRESDTYSLYDIENLPNSADTYRTKKFILVDDRWVSFDHAFPRDSIGFLVEHGDKEPEVVTTPTGQLPHNIIKSVGLTAVREKVADMLHLYS